MNPYIDLFNYSFIRQQAQRQDVSRVYEVQKCANALREFLDNVDKIDPKYQQAANAEFCLLILDYIIKHS